MCLYQIDIPVQQSYLWYASSQGDADPQVCKLGSILLEFHILSIISMNAEIAIH